MQTYPCSVPQSNPRAPHPPRVFSCTVTGESPLYISSSAICLVSENYRLSGAFVTLFGGALLDISICCFIKLVLSLSRNLLDILSFSLLVIIQAIEEKRLGVERVCGPSSTCLFLSSTLFVPHTMCRSVHALLKRRGQVLHLNSL